MVLALRDLPNAKERREALEKSLNVKLPRVGSFSIDERVAASRNCENMIGAVQVPLGIAGPLAVSNGKSELESYYVPMATTEGALVASVNRGCKAIAESNGAKVVSKKIGITRAPVFAVKNIEEGAKFIEDIDKHFLVFKKIAEGTSAHLELSSIKPWMVGRNVYLRFSFDSQDAMGMNMATIATTEVCLHIQEKTNAKLISVSGNMCVDKKPNFLNFLEGRGISVWADVLIPEEVINKTLKTTAKGIIEVVEAKLVYGSILSGSIGSNAQMANVLSAIFLATGQDIAHVSECAAGVTTAELWPNEGKDGLYISVYLPDLVIGTVGGGTGLETQRESLSIMGITGATDGKNVQKFAGIIAGAVLAGELSLLSSLSEGSLSKAHQKLGRGVKK